MLFGTDERAPIVLSVLGLTPADTGRFRDAWAELDDQGAVRLVIHTRNGGGNREEYESVIDALAAHPLYVDDEDDDFDCTYANFYFRAPPEYEAEFRAVAENKPVVMGERWLQMIEAIRNAPVPQPPKRHATEPATEEQSK